MLDSGEIVIRNPHGQELLTLQSGLGSDVVDIAAPQTVDESYFALLTEDGRLKVYNYTVIDSPNTFLKYAKENYGLKGRVDNKTLDEIKESKAG